MGVFSESVVELAEATVVMTRGRGEGRCRYLCFGREHHHHPPNPRAKQANPRHYKDVGLPSHSMLLQSCTPNLVLVQLYILVFLFVLVLPHSLHLFSSLGWEKYDVVFHPKYNVLPLNFARRRFSKKHKGEQFHT